MMRMMLTAVCVLCVSATVTSSAPSEFDVNSLRQGVVRIIRGGSDTPVKDVGEGIIVRRDGDEAYIVTVLHVIYDDLCTENDLAEKLKDAPENEIKVFFLGDRTPVKVHVVHSELSKSICGDGLALLRVEGVPAELVALPLATDVALDIKSISQAVSIIGPQGNEYWQVFPGVVEGVGGDTLKFRSTIIQGDSGGPLVADGHVVGIVRAFTKGTDHASAFSAERIQTYLDNQLGRIAPAGVIVIGGQVSSGRWDNSVENWDPRTNRWRRLPSVPDTDLCRAGAVMLGDGRILVAGGGGTDDCSDNGTTTRRVTTFRPMQNLWDTPACGEPCMRLGSGLTLGLDRGSKAWRPKACKLEGMCMMYGRNNFPSLALMGGRAFVYGGCAGGCNGPNAIYQTVMMRTPDGRSVGELARVAEIFDPQSNTWFVTPPSHKPRTAAAATELLGGQVLVCGGNDGFNTTYDDCEVYDLDSDFNGHQAWSWAGRMPTVGTPLLARLPDGSVLGVGGTQWWIWKLAGNYWGASAEDQVGAWKVGGTLPTLVTGGVLIALSDGRALLSGGTASGEPSHATQLYEYDQVTKRGSWRNLAPMKNARYGHVAVELKSGGVIAAGGCGTTPLASAELLDLKTGTWSDAGQMSRGRCWPLVVQLPEHP